jgi:hypothetical protein
MQVPRFVRRDPAMSREVAQPPQPQDLGFVAQAKERNQK